MTSQKNNITDGFKILIKYRYLIWMLSLKELKTQYRGSYLGFFWSLMNPLLLLIIYTFLFVIVFKNPAKAYPVYLFCGILPFTWFQSSILVGTASISGGGSLVSKSLMPPEIIVMSKIGANLLNYLLAVPILILFVYIFKMRIGLPLLYFPLLIIIEFFLIAGVSLFFAALNVFYRDIQFIILNLTTFLFFSMPVMYFDKQLPLKIRHLIYLNPVAYIMKCFQDIFYFNVAPRPLFVLGILFISLIFFIAGYTYFAARKELFSEFV
ncbi:MAG: ABC transporter permease [Candidatus Acididesulfobacter diazotrophicus]|uniref:Transport permease protein n=1 Tax=Candidatus Acididesulfobacter diazotrophicus TaxID=2597226 RepID=A0A519BN03_9DELT|nr:MAG: ABC transporter permease [Candidatus Acididesulfobacter diazotrophicus]